MWGQGPDDGRGERPWQELREESVAQKKERGRVRALTPNQGKFLKAVETSTITVCTGPAGTGKTYLACGVAAGMLQDQRVGRVVLARPLVTCGDGVGYLKGDLSEKIGPYMRPLLDALGDFFRPRDLERRVREGTVELLPLEFMRGVTLKDCVAVCDEAQNATYEQLRMLLTRVGQGCRLVLTGDATQTDLPHGGDNPLLKVVRRFRPDCHPDVSLVRLYAEDIVRHGIIQWVEERLAGPKGPEE